MATRFDMNIQVINKNCRYIYWFGTWNGCAFAVPHRFYVGERRSQSQQHTILLHCCILNGRNGFSSYLIILDCLLSIVAHLMRTTCAQRISNAFWHNKRPLTMEQTAFSIALSTESALKIAVQSTLEYCSLVFSPWLSRYFYIYFIIRICRVIEPDAFV